MQGLWGIREPVHARFVTHINPVPLIKNVDLVHNRQDLNIWTALSCAIVSFLVKSPVARFLLAQFRIFKVPFGIPGFSFSTVCGNKWECPNRRNFVTVLRLTAFVPAMTRRPEIVPTSGPNLGLILICNQWPLSGTRGTGGTSTNTWPKRHRRSITGGDTCGGPCIHELTYISVLIYLRHASTEALCNRKDIRR